jgi:hypothetical protein
MPPEMLFLVFAIVGLCFIGAFFPLMGRLAVILICLGLLGGLGFFLSRAKPETVDVTTWAVCFFIAGAVVYIGWVIFGIRRDQGEAKGGSSTSRRRSQL